MVYLLEVEKESRNWPEKNERQREWLSTNDAAERVDERGLADIIERLEARACGPHDGSDDLPSRRAFARSAGSE